MGLTVAVLGASPNPSRYSNRAIRDLVAHGHDVIPINPAHKSIEGIATVEALGRVTGAIDTITVYVGPDRIGGLIDGIIAAKPRRVIANPGAESRELEQRLKAANISYIEACTLVMLRTGQF